MFSVIQTYKKSMFNACSVKQSHPSIFLQYRYARKEVMAELDISEADLAAVGDVGME